jgi:hypothetical protein
MDRSVNMPSRLAEAKKRGKPSSSAYSRTYRDSPPVGLVDVGFGFGLRVAVGLAVTTAAVVAGVEGGAGGEEATGSATDADAVGSAGGVSGALAVGTADAADVEGADADVIGISPVRTMVLAAIPPPIPSAIPAAASMGHSFDRFFCRAGGGGTVEAKGSKEAGLTSPGRTLWGIGGNDRAGRSSPERLSISATRSARSESLGLAIPSIHSATSR